MSQVSISFFMFKPASRCLLFFKMTSREENLYKRHILYFCAIIVEKIRSHLGEVHEAMFVVVSVPTNGSIVTRNVVIWLSFLSIKFSSQRSTFFG